MACCRCERPWRRATKLALPVEGHGTGAWHSISCRSQSCFDDARRCDGAGRRPQDHRLPKRRWLHARARMAPSPAAMPAPMRTHLQLPLRGLLPLQMLDDPPVVWRARSPVSPCVTSSLLSFVRLRTARIGRTRAGPGLDPVQLRARSHSLLYINGYIHGL